MQLAYHYLRLCTHFSSERVDSPIQTTLQELTDVLCCTTRNVKLILRQMAETGWIEWLPGRGRGNRSWLICRVEMEAILTQLAQEHVLKGNVEEAIQLLHEWSIRSEGKDRFFTWLLQHFGYQVEDTPQQQVDILRMPFYRPIPAIDPAFTVRRTESHMVKQVFDTLLRYEAATDRFVPLLAHHWECDEEMRCWTFYLRKGILFHHGRELTADDVRATLQRIANPAVKSPFAWMVAEITHIEVVKKTVVRMELARPNPLFLHVLASDRLSIVPAEICVEKGRDFSRFPIGSGPFRLVRNDDAQFVLEAFPQYFLGRPHLDRVEVWVLPELVKHGVKEGVDGYRLAYLPFKRQDEYPERWRYMDNIEVGAKYVTFQLNKPGIQQHKPFRLLMERLLDREKLIADLGEDRYCAAHSFFPHRSWQVQEQKKEGQLLADPAEELRQCGYQGETLRLYTYEGAGNEKDAAWIAREYGRYGIRIDLTVLTISQLKEAVHAGEADMILAGEVMDEDIQLAIVEMYRTENSFFRYQLNDELRMELDARVQAAVEEQERDVRLQKLEEIENLLVSEQTMMFLYHSRQQSAHDPALKGVTLNSLGWIDYRNIWF
ncbi:SgrR family transcriptional regulator [Brevibacillus migulae]|uniref:SgrR family transcriptional regulator n=1 Tax=Brevibacillus migulae TaxID=1644114 RepID=UPI00106DDF22|nr:SgrR family transcriptional regulator [Brevibacillus migulae]